MGFSLINHPFGGYPHDYGNPQLWVSDASKDFMVIRLETDPKKSSPARSLVRHPKRGWGALVGVLGMFPMGSTKISSAKTKWKIIHFSRGDGRRRAIYLTGGWKQIGQDSLKNKKKNNHKPTDYSPTHSPNSKHPNWSQG